MIRASSCSRHNGLSAQLKKKTQMYRRAWLLTLQSLWTPQYVNVIGKIKEEAENRQREGRGGETYFILHSVNPFLHQVSSVLSCAAVLRNTRVLDIRLVFRVHVLPPSTHNHLQSRKTDWTILKTTFEDIIVGVDQSAQSISCAPWAKKKKSPCSTVHDLRRRYASKETTVLALQCRAS